MIKRFVTSTLLLLLCVTVAHAQGDFSIEGTVTDAQSGEPLPGANVVVVGTDIGTSTDANGAFSLTAPSGQDTLSISFVGYQTREVPIRERSTIDVALEREALRSEELVVIGYGTRERGQLTGSVSSIDTEDIEIQGPTHSVDQLLEGRVPGLRAVFGSGNPGEGADISIRGPGSITAESDPLWVVDGLPQNAPPNTQDIASIEVLKDASATAIYGARAAGGVILVTTKSGQEGDLQVNYTGELSSQRVARKLDLLSPQEYQRVLNDIIDDGGASEEQRVEEIANGGTDWQDQVLRTAPQQQHTLSFSGGSAGTQYYVSLGAFHQDGIIMNSNFRRYQARLNLDHEITDRFQLTTRFNALYRTDNDVRNNFGVNENAGVLYAAYNFDPTLPVRNEEGEFTQSPDITADNPLAIAEGIDETSRNIRTFGTVSGEYFLLPSLSAELQLGTDLFGSRNDNYISRQTLFGAASGGQATIFNNRWREFLVEGTLNYDQTFDVHDVNAVTGITAEQQTTWSNFVSGQNFPTDVTGTHNMGLSDSELDNNNSNTSSHQLLSYFGRLNYTFSDRYVLTATMRFDGSSRFGEQNRYGYFPSLALAWRMSEESFLDDVESLSTLKLRGSWGQTGNDQIGNYSSIQTFSGGPPVIFNDEQTTTTRATRLGNPNLQWETSEQTDVGLEVGLLDDRFYANVGYFRKETKDLLLNVPVPTSTGFGTQLQNLGSVKNTGWEIGLESRNVERAGFTWSTNVNFSTLNNEVLDIGETDQILRGGAGFTSPIFVVREGLPMNTFYGYEIEGIWQEGDDFSQIDNDQVQPGNLKFRDVNGDQQITGEDRVPLGNPYPDYSWSIGNTVTVGNFQLYAFVDGVEGVKMINNNLVDTYFPVNFRRNRLAEPLLNRWTPENPSEEYPSFVAPRSQGPRPVNSYTVQDASYVRLKTVRVGYTFNQPFDIARSLEIYASGENLYTITDYIGVDPAVSPGGANARIDYNVYPTTRTYTFGVKLGL